MQQTIALHHRTGFDRIKDFLRGIGTFLRLIASNRVGLLGFIMVLFFVGLSFIGPHFVPLDTKTKVSEIYVPPSWEHPLGTDHQGRDVWSQIVHGGKDILYVAFLTGLISTFIGVFFGSLSAIIGGGFDSLLSGLADVWLTIPRFPLLAVLAGFIRLDSLSLLALILGVLGWAGLFRAVRAQVFSFKERDYVEAARALDLGLGHIIFSEILPNMMSYIAINFTFAMTSAIYAQTSLVFLGLVPISTSNWGVMISLAWTRGAIFFKDSIYYIMSPIMAIALLQLALVWMGRSLEAVFNPRLRAGA